VGDIKIRASQERWIERISAAQSTLIVVSGLVFTLNLNAVISLDMSKENVCARWFRATSCVGLTTSAVSILVSLILITVLSICQSDKATKVHMHVLVSLIKWSQIGGAFLFLTVVLTLVSVLIAAVATDKFKTGVSVVMLCSGGSGHWCGLHRVPRSRHTFPPRHNSCKPMVYAREEIHTPV
jgi:hypothetical protein